jgi:hypothetical protein
MGFVKPASIALACWFAGLIAITPILEPTRDVLVFGRTEAIAALPASGAALIDAASGWTRVRRMEAGFVRRLYANGAWLVFPAFDGGCIRLVGPLIPPRLRGGWRTQ